MSNTIGKSGAPTPLTPPATPDVRDGKLTDTGMLRQLDGLFGTSTARAFDAPMRAGTAEGAPRIGPQAQERGASFLDHLKSAASDVKSFFSGVFAQIGSLFAGGGAQRAPEFQVALTDPHADWHPAPYNGPDKDTRLALFSGLVENVDASNIGTFMRGNDGGTNELAAKIGTEVNFKANHQQVLGEMAPEMNALMAAIRGDAEATGEPISISHSLIRCNLEVNEKACTAAAAYLGALLSTDPETPGAVMAALSDETRAEFAERLDAIAQMPGLSPSEKGQLSRSMISNDLFLRNASAAGSNRTAQMDTDGNAQFAAEKHLNGLVQSFVNNRSAVRNMNPEAAGMYADLRQQMLPALNDMCVALGMPQEYRNVT